MILINLLPHREAARKRRRELFFAVLGLSAFFGGLLAGLIFLAYDAQMSAQRARNAFLQTEITKLDGKIKDIATLQTEIDGLKARQKAVEDLQADRNQPVHLLNELVRQLPDGIYVASVKQDNLQITLQGVAQSNERVSELLRNLSNNSPWLSKPELVEIVASSATLSPRDAARRVANFTIRAQLVRAAEAAKSPASAPARAASAPTS